ncbi:ethanolaminephosphotransferase [Drechmeria coniospora]|uniref:Ethanolaminephosphotransferase n=1 Tax=Drechmeria coniospora TaxID=98403 RepID=A0A151GS12_DRECN|nr:ethanolaminephosphotransferase [Drechmeria coniospora]KYK59904.1 ethanolaminephosphotransferase [Drechmeria coniospora]
MVYVRQMNLAALREYKYSSVDRSLTSKYIMRPWWNFVISFFPLSIAPNLITLTGFMFVVVNFLTLLWYTPLLDQDCPRWVYFSWALGLFLYQTFDAIDGSQARRTKQSGPLGELFDHGVDALNTTLEVLIFAASQNMGQGWRTVATLFACEFAYRILCLPPFPIACLHLLPWPLLASPRLTRLDFRPALLTFYVQTWDEYHTKTLTLGFVNGPVEGVLILVTVYALTGFLGGAHFWQQSMLRTLGVPETLGIPPRVYALSFTDWYLVQGGIVLVLNTVESSFNVIRARRANGDKSRGALVGLLPFFATWFLIVTYLCLNNDILRNHLVPFVLFAGLINAYSVGQMITAHLTKMSFPYVNVLMFPLIFGVVDSLGPFLQSRLGFGWPSVIGNGEYQVGFVFLMLGTGFGIYGSFVVDVIVTICDYLDIWCLTIKHPFDEIGHEVANGKTKNY